MAVVVLFVGGQDAVCVGGVEDEDVVEDFSAKRADDPFAVGVGSRRLRWGFEDVDVAGVENRVKAAGVLGIAVSDKKPQ
jgi:hypothetical protein